MIKNWNYHFQFSHLLRIKMFCQITWNNCVKFHSLELLNLALRHQRKSQHFPYLKASSKLRFRKFWGFTVLRWGIWDQKILRSNRKWNCILTYFSTAFYFSESSISRHLTLQSSFSNSLPSYSSVWLEDFPSNKFFV